MLCPKVTSSLAEIRGQLFVKQLLSIRVNSIPEEKPQIFIFKAPAEANKLCRLSLRGTGKSRVFRIEFQV